MRKDSANKMIAGVCSGIAKTSGINVSILRLLFVISGIGIPLYLILAIVMQNDQV